MNIRSLVRRVVEDLLRPGTLVGLGVGVIGILLSIWFYKQSLREPILRFLVTEPELLLDPAEWDSDLTVFASGSAIRSPIYKQDVVIWNNGKGAIESEALLEPITINYSDDESLLATRVAIESRSVCEVHLSQPHRNQIIVMPRILEYQDGAIIEVLSVGEFSEQPVVSAVVKNSRKLEEYIPGKTDRMRIFGDDVVSIVVAAAIAIVLFGIAVAISIRLFRKIAQYTGRNAEDYTSYGFVTTVLFVILEIGVVYSINGDILKDKERKEIVGGIADSLISKDGLPDSLVRDE